MEKIKHIIPDYQDGEFMSPKSGAKLASLFGLDRAESQGNESFQFTAPKQPRKSCGVVGPPPPCAPAVLFATAVHAFCFVNGQYVKQGKIGAAILGNHVTKEYKILLYGSKQKQITTARIHRGFVLTVQPCNYVTFYDDQEQNWSILFDSEKARPEFCREVCLARWNSEASSDCLVTQDLVQGEGQAVGVGDAVEVACSGWLLQNHCLGQIFDFNVGEEKLQRVRLGARKAVRGWEDGMLGMQKGGRRLLIVPPGLVYGSKGVPNHVPANSTLVFDVEIHRIKFSKDRQGGGSVDIFSTSSGICSDTQSEENSQLGTTDTDESKDRGAYGKVESIDECQTSSDASKAKLISRIAKMGQPMLPFLTGAVPAQPEPSDSDTERVSVQDASESELLCDPCPSSKPTHMLCSSPSCTLSDQPDDSQKQEEDSNPAQDFKPCSFRQSSYFPSQLNSFTSIHPSQHISWQTPDITSLLMSDARHQNAEILMAIEKVAHGVDQLTCKVDHLQKECHFSFGLSSVSLETNMMLYNIQRIVQGSMCLEKDVQEKSSQVEEQKPKIGELSEQNRRYVEQQHNQTRHLQTEHEKVHLSGELSSSTIHSCHLQQELVDLQQRAAEIQAELSEALSDKHKHCAQISLLEAHVEELVKQREQAERQWRMEKQKCKEMEATIQNVEEEMQDLRTEKENLDQVLSDRKRKWQTEREAQGEYPRGQQEMSQLLVLLRKASDSTEPLVKQAEFEVGWQKKCDATVEEQKKQERTITELQEQYEDLKKTSQNQKKQFETQLVVQVKRMMNEVFQSLRKEFDQQESYSGHAALVILQNTIKSVTMKLLTEPLELESGAEEDLSTEEVFSNGNVQ